MILANSSSIQTQHTHKAKERVNEGEKKKKKKSLPLEELQNVVDRNKKLDTEEGEV